MDIRVYGKGVYWLSIISWTTCNLHYMKLFKAGKIFNPKESNVPSKNPNFLTTPLASWTGVNFYSLHAMMRIWIRHLVKKMLRNSGVRYSLVFSIHDLSSS